ncbi:hypothetical protein KGM_202002 [Danaus plexippus plexippus]|uniref:Uncharacterized protein n=1 Tax=Danaus plexippus plexippus TaxID=278856 RepID=A0A212EKR2_DANPL|nr:hypothetical protein KGM_202002 [Danaus plexippus plexippus]
MARAPEPIIDDAKFLTPALTSITESLSLLGLSPETLAMSLGESLAERYLAALRPKPVPLASCGAPRRQPLSEPSNLQLFSNDFIDYLNQIAVSLAITPNHITPSRYHDTSSRHVIRITTPHLSFVIRHV